MHRTGTQSAELTEAQHRSTQARPRQQRHKPLPPASLAARPCERVPRPPRTHPQHTPRRRTHPHRRQLGKRPAGRMETPLKESFQAVAPVAHRAAPVAPWAANDRQIDPLIDGQREQRPWGHPPLHVFHVAIVTVSAIIDNTQVSPLPTTVMSRAPRPTGAPLRSRSAAWQLVAAATLACRLAWRPRTWHKPARSNPHRPCSDDLEPCRGLTCPGIVVHNEQASTRSVQANGVPRERRKTPWRPAPGNSSLVPPRAPGRVPSKTNTPATPTARVTA